RRRAAAGGRPGGRARGVRAGGGPLPRLSVRGPGAVRPAAGGRRRGRRGRDAAGSAAAGGRRRRAPGRGPPGGGAGGRGRGPGGLMALAGYVEGLAEVGRVAVYDCIRRYRDQLRGEVKCWGAVGYALATLGDYRAAALWLGDYADRTGLAPWMLSNLVIAL